MDVKVCTTCGGVALPPESEREGLTCSTPGCSMHGELLENQVIEENDAITCPICGVTTLKDSGHSHKE